MDCVSVVAVDNSIASVPNLLSHLGGKQGKQGKIVWAARGTCSRVNLTSFSECKYDVF